MRTIPDDELPRCACGCGEPITLQEERIRQRDGSIIVRKRYDRLGKYAKGHTKHRLAKLAGPPACGCGCGEKVTWDPERKCWNAYRVGHRIRLYENNPNPPGSQLGRKLSPEHIAKLSGQNNWRHRPENAHRVPLLDRENNPNWKGGKQRMTLKEAAERHAQRMTGAGNPAFIDGRSEDPEKQKYKFRWIDGTSVREHRFVMEQAIGRELEETEVVHHVDENKLNNAPSNLFLFHCTACHAHYHRADVPLLYKYLAVHPNRTELVESGKRTE